MGGGRGGWMGQQNVGPKHGRVPFFVFLTDHQYLVSLKQQAAVFNENAL